MSESTEIPPKLTPTQRLHEVTIAALSRRPAEPESSVTIARNARGVFQFEVTVRGGDADACKTQAETVVRELEASYPYANGGES